MQLTPIVLSAGVPSRLALTGDYFRLVTANAAVTVRLYRKGRPFAEAAGILGGYWAKPTDGFEEVEVLSASSQTVIVGTAYGLGGYDRAAGDVNITNAKLNIADSVGANLLALGVNGGFTVGNHTLFPVVEGGYGYGSSYASTTSLTLGGTSALFVAGSNPNGAILWSCSLFTGSAASQILSLLAKTSVPTTPVDGDLIHSATIGAGISSTAFGILLARAVRIASGKGLYLFSSVLETIAGRSALFTLF